MCQFDQTKGFHSFTDAVDYCFPILTSTESELLRVYSLWEHRFSTEFRDSHPSRTPEYQSQLDTDLGIVIEGAINDDGTFEEEPIEDFEDDPTRLIEYDLFVGLTEALAGDPVPTGPAFMATSISELECRI